MVAMLRSSCDLYLRLSRVDQRYRVPRTYVAFIWEYGCTTSRYAMFFVGKYITCRRFTFTPEIWPQNKRQPNVPLLRPEHAVTSSIMHLYGVSSSYKYYHAPRESRDSLCWRSGRRIRYPASKHRVTWHGNRCNRHLLWTGFLLKTLKGVMGILLKV